MNGPSHPPMFRDIISLTDASNMASGFEEPLVPVDAASSPPSAPADTYAGAVVMVLDKQTG